jgi:hypothetical protein
VRTGLLEHLESSLYAVLAAKREMRPNHIAKHKRKLRRVLGATGLQLARLGAGAAFAHARGDTPTELANAGVKLGILGSFCGLPATSANLGIIGWSVPLLHRLPAFLADAGVEVVAVFCFDRIAAMLCLFGAGNWPSFGGHAFFSFDSSSIATSRACQRISIPSGAIQTEAVKPGNLSIASLTHPTSRTPPISERLHCAQGTLCVKETSEDPRLYRFVLIACDEFGGNLVSYL